MFTVTRQTAEYFESVAANDDILMIQLLIDSFQHSEFFEEKMSYSLVVFDAVEENPSYI